MLSFIRQWTHTYTKVLSTRFQSPARNSSIVQNKFENLELRGIHPYNRNRKYCSSQLRKKSARLVTCHHFKLEKTSSWRWIAAFCQYYIYPKGDWEIDDEQRSHGFLWFARLDGRVALLIDLSQEARICRCVIISNRFSPHLTACKLGAGDSWQWILNLLP